MTQKTRFGRRPAVAAVVASAGLLAGAGAAHAAGLSCTGLPAAGLTTSNPIACAVNCAAGGTLASAVALKPRTTSRLTITVSGTCVGSTDDLPGGITIQGASSSATLQAPSATTDPVLGISGTGVQLAKLTIKAGVHALRGHQGSSFTATSVIVEGASEADVLLNHAVATLNTSTIENSAGDGIKANFGSTAFVNGGTIEKNAGWGVSAFGNGSVNLFGGVLVQKNTTGGAIAGGGSSIELSGGSVSANSGAGFKVWLGGNVDVDGTTAPASVVSNGSDGIQVYQSTAIIRNGANIASNAGDGVLLYNGANVVVFGGGVVQSNTGDGIRADNGNLQVGGGGGATVRNNHGNGIILRTDSIGSFASSANKITGNAGWGILCTGAPSNPLIFGAIGTVTGNTKGQIACKVAP